MRAAATVTVTLLLTAMSGACMAPLEAEELVLVDEEEIDPPDLRSIPDGERAPSPPPEPPPVEAERSPAVGSDVPYFDLSVDEEGCTVVSAEGFPAISPDGRTVVVPAAEHFQLSDLPGTLGLQRHDVELGTITWQEVVAAGDGLRDDDMSCEPSAARALRRRVRALNRELASQPWRTMEPLPVEYYDPYTFDIELYKEGTPPSERMVQLIIQHGEILARIAGVRVLEREPLASHMQGSVHEAYGDRETGSVVVVSMTCAGDSCTCDPAFSAQVLRWAPETFDAIERRPCEDDESTCEPIDYGFNGQGLAWTI